MKKATSTLKKSERTQTAVAVVKQTMKHLRPLKVAVVKLSRWLKWLQQSQYKK
ncbi:MAG: hypothetical protein ACFFDM_12325 [Candidatus Thorarchaeota archaeon]